MKDTFQELLDLINSLIDGGNNSASQVREVLTAMANYNHENNSEGFEIASQDLVKTDGQTYHYSFKGIRNQCCNAYLLLNNTTKVTNANSETHNIPAAAANTGSLFVFNITEEEYNILADFIPVKSEVRISLTYVVTTFSEAQARLIAVFLDKGDDGTFSIQVDTNIASSEVVTTAIALNFKRFTMPKNNAKIAGEFLNVVKMKSDIATEATVKTRTTVKTPSVTEGKP